MTTPLLLAKVTTYKAKALYSGVHNWTQTTQAIKHISVTIRSDMLASIPQSISSMFLNNARFASYRIVMLSHLLTHLNPSSRENLLLSISDITCLEMRIGKSSINFMLRVQGISQLMQDITMDRTIPLFVISSLNRDRYLGVKSHYLAGDITLIKCNLIDLSGLFSS